jgi:Uma2 family endonuclease
MATVGTQLMTAEEFYDFVHRPENHGRHFELERGEVVEMPPPGEVHGVICGLMVHILNVYLFQRRAGYACCNDTGIRVSQAPDTVRGPDILLFLEARRLDDLSPKYPDRAPVLTVEVLSPTNKWGEIMMRVGQFLRRGVKMVWVVDPDMRTVSLHTPGQEPTNLDDTEKLTCEDVLPGFRCRVADFFALPGDVS